jgi:hypothetical protein
MRPAARGILAAAALLSLTGCLSLGDGDGQREQETAGLPVEDPDSGRFYFPDALPEAEATAVLAEHLPALPPAAALTVHDGQYTDPAERVPLPAQDDYWWQAVVELESAEVAELLEIMRSTGTSDGGGLYDEAPSTDDDLLTTIVPPLEELIGSCPAGWVDVTGAFTEDGYPDRSAGGDLLQEVRVCEGGTQLIIAATDM